MTNKQLLARALSFDAGLPPKLNGRLTTPKDNEKEGLKHLHLVIRRYGDYHWRILSHEGSEFVLVKSGPLADQFVHQEDAIKNKDPFIFVSPEAAFFWLIDWRQRQS